MSCRIRRRTPRPQTRAVACFRCLDLVSYIIVMPLELGAILGDDTSTDGLGRTMRLCSTCVKAERGART